MDCHESQKSPTGDAVLNAKEERLRTKLRLRQSSTGNHVDSTRAASRHTSGQSRHPIASTASSGSATITSSSQSLPISDEAKERLNSSLTNSNNPEIQKYDRATATTTENTHSRSESISKGSAQSPSQSNSNSQQAGSHGRKRKGERRRMNQDAQKKGEPMPFENRGGGGRHHPGGRGPPPPHYRGGPHGPDIRREGHPPRGDLRGPPDRRGPPPRGEYDYSHHPRSRSRSPRGHRDSHRDRRGRSRSRSGSASSHSVSSRSKSRSHSRSPRRSRSDHSSRRGEKRRRSGSDHRSGSGRRSGSGARRSGTGRGDGSRGSRASGSGSRRSKHSGSHRSHSSSSSSSSEGDPPEKLGTKEDESTFSKDQRTVFVSQLVMRATEKDVRRYFRKKVGCQVKAVILLKDKRTGSHKGCAYVELGRIEDVNKAVGVAGQPPDFQRFPILVKPSEAEKNYVIQASSSVLTASMMGTSASSKPVLSAEGKMIESQKVYVGGLDPSVTEEHIFALFSQFGQLEKVSMQMDPATKTSRGYAFLAYRDPKEANLAIQTMSNQVLAGRPIKTGWASQTSTAQGVEITTSEEFPEEATGRAKKALTVLAQMSGVTDGAVANATISATAERALDAAMAGAQASKPNATAVPTVAQVRATLATEATPGPAALPGSVPGELKLIGGSGVPTNNILVHSMFDKDEETGDTWPAEVKEEFEEECSKFGKIISATVMSDEPGGKIYASFDTVDAAVQCAKNLAGRWFDKRQLRVDYMQESEMPKSG